MPPRARYTAAVGPVVVQPHGGIFAFVVDCFTGALAGTSDLRQCVHRDPVTGRDPSGAVRGLNFFLEAVVPLFEWVKVRVLPLTTAAKQVELASACYVFVVSVGPVKAAYTAEGPPSRVASCHLRLLSQRLYDDYVLVSSGQSRGLLDTRVSALRARGSGCQAGSFNGRSDLSVLVAELGGGTPAERNEWAGRAAEALGQPDADVLSDAVYCADAAKLAERINARVADMHGLVEAVAEDDLTTNTRVFELDLDPESLACQRGDYVCGPLPGCKPIDAATFSLDQVDRAMHMARAVLASRPFDAAVSAGLMASLQEGCTVNMPAVFAAYRRAAEETTRTLLDVPTQARALDRAASAKPECRDRSVVVYEAALAACDDASLEGVVPQVIQVITACLSALPGTQVACHIQLVGGPGTGKSQLAKLAKRIIPGPTQTANHLTGAALRNPMDGDSPLGENVNVRSIKNGFVILDDIVDDGKPVGANGATVNPTQNALQSLGGEGFYTIFQCSSGVDPQARNWRAHPTVTVSPVCLLWVTNRFANGAFGDRFSPVLCRATSYGASYSAYHTQRAAAGAAGDHTALVLRNMVAQAGLVAQLRFVDGRPSLLVQATVDKLVKDKLFTRAREGGRLATMMFTSALLQVVAASMTYKLAHLKLRKVQPTADTPVGRLSWLTSPLSAEHVAQYVHWNSAFNPSLAAMIILAEGNAADAAARVMQAVRQKSLFEGDHGECIQDRVTYRIVQFPITPESLMLADSPDVVRAEIDAMTRAGIFGKHNKSTKANPRMLVRKDDYDRTVSDMEHDVLDQLIQDTTEVAIAARSYVRKYIEDRRKAAADRAAARGQPPPPHNARDEQRAVDDCIVLPTVEWTKNPGVEYYALSTEAWTKIVDYIDRGAGTAASKADCKAFENLATLVRGIDCPGILSLQLDRLHRCVVRANVADVTGYVFDGLEEGGVDVRLAAVMPEHLFLVQPSNKTTCILVAKAKPPLEQNACVRFLASLPTYDTDIYVPSRSGTLKIKTQPEPFVWENLKYKPGLPLPRSPEECLDRSGMHRIDVPPWFDDMLAMYNALYRDGRVPASAKDYFSANIAKKMGCPRGQWEPTKVDLEWVAYARKEGPEPPVSIMSSTIFAAALASNPNVAPGVHPVLVAVADRMKNDRDFKAACTLMQTVSWGSTGVQKPQAASVEPAFVTKCQALHLQLERDTDHALPRLEASDEDPPGPPTPAALDPPPTPDPLQRRLPAPSPRPAPRLPSTPLFLRGRVDPVPPTPPRTTFVRRQAGYTSDASDATVASPQIGMAGRRRRQPIRDTPEPTGQRSPSPKRTRPSPSPRRETPAVVRMGSRVMPSPITYPSLACLSDDEDERDLVSSGRGYTPSYMET
jgi:hypothetical protein